MAAELIISALKQRLENKNICVLREFEALDIKRHEHSVVVLGIENITAENQGMGDYLGMLEDENTGVFVNQYGKRLSLRIRADIFVSPELGSAEAEETFALLSDVLLSGGCGGEMRSMTRERIAYDEETGMLCIRCSVDLSALFIFSSPEDEVYFTDFRLGEVTIHV